MKAFQILNDDDKKSQQPQNQFLECLSYIFVRVASYSWEKKYICGQIKNFFMSFYQIETQLNITTEDAPLSMNNKMNQLNDQNCSQNERIESLKQIESKSTPREEIPDLPNMKYLGQNSSNWQIFKKRQKIEEWSLSQVQKLFSIYAQHGPQWKIIQTQLPNKSSNSIKNRFYSVLRTFLRELFLCHPQLKNEVLPEISSKIILRFYEGRKEFYRFREFGKKVLRMINYNVYSGELIRIAQKKLRQITSIYQLIYKTRSRLACKPLSNSRTLLIEQKQTPPPSSPNPSLSPQYQFPNVYLYPYTTNFDYIFFPSAPVAKYEEKPLQPFVIFNINTHSEL